MLVTFECKECPVNPAVSELSLNPVLEETSPERVDKRIQVVLPLRVTYWDRASKPCPDMACTYDISPRGARIMGLRSAPEVGDILAIERTRNNKIFCRVIWVGPVYSELRCQVGIQGVESERLMWDAELRDIGEIYDPVLLKDDFGKLNSAVDDRNRRRGPRFTISGTAELHSQNLSVAPAEAAWKDLSERGCLIMGTHTFLPGADLRVVLNIAQYGLGLKGQLSHVVQGLGTGIEFREIRKGDRQILQFLLRKLAEQELEASFELELQHEQEPGGLEPAQETGLLSQP